MDSYLGNIVSHFIEAEGRVKLVPAIIRLKCQLISSREVVERTRIIVKGKRSSNPPVFCHKRYCNINLLPMNDYRQSYVHDIDLFNDFEYESISDTFEMYAIRFDQITVNFYF